MRLRYLIAVATLAVGCTPGTTETGDASDPATQPGSGNTVPVGPQRSNSHESDGPLEAALAYVASTDTLMAHSSIGRAEIFRSLVTPETVADQAAAFEQAAEQ